jgi:hypothetical protein
VAPADRADLIEVGGGGEIYLRCESGDMLTAFLDSLGRIVIQVPLVARGLPHAAMTAEEATALIGELAILVQTARRAPAGQDLEAPE